MSFGKIAIIAGGWSSEREVSLKSGQACFDALSNAGEDVVIFDPAEDISRLIDIKDELSAVLVVLHGRYGEDGRIQGFLECLNLPYAGAGLEASVLAFDKIRSKEKYREAGLVVAPDYIIKSGEKADIDSIIEKVGLPLVVKPNKDGSTVGMSFVEEKNQLKEAIKLASRSGEEILIEKMISGVEVTAGVLDMEDQGLTALPLVEIRPKTGKYFDYERKYTPGATEEICPAHIDEETTRRCQEIALTAHRALGIDHWSRTDIIISNGKEYILETNTLPGMTKESLFPKEAAACGMDMAALLMRLAALAVRDRSNN